MRTRDCAISLAYKPLAREESEFAGPGLFGLFEPDQSAKFFGRRACGHLASPDLVLKRLDVARGAPATLESGE